MGLGLWDELVGVPEAEGEPEKGELLTGPWVSLQDMVPLLISNQGWVVPGTAGEGALGLKYDPGTGNQGSPGLGSPVRERAVPANTRPWWETSELVCVMCFAGEPWVG